VEMSRDLYKKYWHDNQISRVYVRVLPQTNATVVRDSIARELGNTYSLRILSASELAEYFASQVRRAFAGAHILAGMVLFVVLVGMADTLAASVVERTRELGIIRAVGVRRRYLRRMILVEACLLGILGLMLAGGAGLTLGTLWVRTTFPYLLGWLFNLHLPYMQAAIVMIVTLVVCIAAALLPARFASRLDPAVALRYE